MDLQLAGKTALVTGASKGIGRACAMTLAHEGCDVVLVARTARDLDVVARDIRDRTAVAVRAVAADLSSSEAVERLAYAIGELDVLVNNAGAIPPGDLTSLDEATWRRAWDLKVFGYIAMCRAFYAKLKARGGVIVNVIGSAGERSEPHYLAGSSGNAALIGFTRSLGASAPRDGMRVVGVDPGPVATDRIETLLKARAKRESGDESRWREAFDGTAFGRAATPEEIPDTVAFLASPRSSYTTGVVLTIDDPTRTSL